MLPVWQARGASPTSDGWRRETFKMEKNAEAPPSVFHVESMGTMHNQKTAQPLI